MMEVQQRPSNLVKLEELSQKLDVASAVSLNREWLIKGVIEEAPYAIIVCDAEGKFILWNEAANSLVGEEPTPSCTIHEWPLKYDIRDPHHPSEIIPEGKAPLARALRGETLNEIFMIQGKRVFCSAKPIYCRMEELQGAVAILHEEPVKDNAQRTGIPT